MSPTAERVQTLKSVDLFAQTPDDILVDLAALLEELDFRPGEAIIRLGDVGSAMFIVISGRARVHDGDHTFDYVEPGDFVGEMAALDPEPRMASITAVTDTHVYRLERPPLAELIQRRPEVMRGIFHVLCQRLRARSANLVDDYAYLQQLAKVTAAAAAFEAGVYAPESLDEPARRTDELGDLARVFQRMTREVARREESLRTELQQLRIDIDEVKKARDVAEITASDTFQQLQAVTGQPRGGRAGQAWAELSPPEQLATLKAVSLFATVKDEDLLSINARVEDVRAARGQDVVHEGETGDAAYVILNGRVRIHHENARTLAIFGRYDVFGEMAVLDPEPRNATVTAMLDTQLLRIRRDDLYAVMDSCPEVTSAIIHVLCDRLRSTVRQLVSDRNYTQQFTVVTEVAAAMEAGTYEPQRLDEVTNLPGPLGQLARVLQRMARDIAHREEALRREVQQLRIEIDEARRASEVATVTESDYFKDLQARARQLRQARARRHP